MEFTFEEASLIKAVLGQQQIQCGQPGFLKTAMIMDSVLVKCESIIEANNPAEKLASAAKSKDK